MPFTFAAHINCWMRHLSGGNPNGTSIVRPNASGHDNMCKCRSERMSHQTRLFIQVLLSRCCFGKYLSSMLIQEGPLEKDSPKHVFLKNIWMWRCSTNPCCTTGPPCCATTRNKCTCFLCAHWSGSEPRSTLRKFRHMHE